MPLTEFLRVLSAKYGVSVIWAEGMDKRLVSVEAEDVPIEEIFQGLARRFNVAVEHVGASWYVGEFRNEDKATLVRKAARLSKEDVQVFAESVLGEGGRCRSFTDGLFVATDRAENLRRFSAALDQVETARSDSWVLQLYLISTSKESARDMGLDTNALIDLSYTFAQKSLVLPNSVPSPANGVHLASKFSAVMQAAAKRADVRLVGKPLFVLADGETARVSSGTVTPVPKKTVSDQGTVTTSGFEYVNSGLSAEATIREGGRGTVRLTLKCSLGQITGFVEGAPVQAKDEFSTVAVLMSSGVYLLGALDQEQAHDTVSGVAPRVMTHNVADAKESQIQIWARLYRIGGPLK